MSAPASPDAAERETAAKAKRPLYPRLLRLRNISPNGWQRALLGEGALALAVVLVLADVASAWTLLALPLGVAAVVKAHDVLAGLLRPDPSDTAPQPELTEEDLGVLAALRDAGADLQEPRTVTFHLYAPDESAARALAGAAERRGFRVSVASSGDGGQGPGPAQEWHVACSAIAVVGPELIRDDVALFERLAAEHAAEYDGWEAAV